MGKKKPKKDLVEEILPWTKPDFLVEAINEKKKEKLEVIELVENLLSDEIPEEVKPIVKKPKKEELIDDDDDDISF
ncbi:hypothetical protein [Thermococcus sp.]